MKDQAEAGEAVGAVEIGLQRRLNQRQRAFEPAAPVMDQAETVQRVEIVGLMVQHRGVEPLRLVELALLVGAQRAAQQPRRVHVQMSCTGRSLVNER